MGYIAYKRWSPGADAKAIIGQADAICADYAAQGYDLTLRQLYYQFVARGLLANTQASYKRLGDIVNNARLAGLLDWDYIVDRTRNLQSVGHWSTPGEIIRSAASSFRLDKWIDQPYRVEVWVEKEALAGVIGQSANRHDVAWFSCRGYVSQSELWGAAQRLGKYIADGQGVVVIHLGDHDPSGIDMTRDIEDRLRLFIATDWLRDHDDIVGTGRDVDDVFEEIEADLAKEPLKIRRIALNYDQVQLYNPPPNPAKMTDSRVHGYIQKHGDQSWELDALDPATLNELIDNAIEEFREPDAYADREDQERVHRNLLTQAARRWPEVSAFLDKPERP